MGIGINKDKIIVDVFNLSRLTALSSEYNFKHFSLFAD